MPTLRVSIDASDAYLEALQDDTQRLEINKKVSFFIRCRLLKMTTINRFSEIMQQQRQPLAFGHLAAHQSV